MRKSLLRKSKFGGLWARLAVFMVVIMMTTTQVMATELTVTSNADSGTGSLRQVLTDASEGDVIRFADNLSGETITLESQLEIKKGITIDASSLENGITISGYRVKVAVYSKNVNIKGMTFTLVAPKDHSQNYTAFYASNSKAVTITDCVFKSCVCDRSPIYLEYSTLSMYNCLVAGNNTKSGVYAAIDCTVTMTNCTVANNSRGDTSVGLFAGQNSTFNVYNCIVTNHNNDVSIESSCTANAYNTLSGFTAWTSGENNLKYETGDDLFANATNNDYNIVSGSKAEDAGNNTYVSGITTDLAGNPRIRNSIVDMGAYETVNVNTFVVICEGDDATTPNSLKYALAHVKEGDIIQLGDDIYLTATMNVTSTMNFTLDLAGHILARSSSVGSDFPVITNKGTLVITDSDATAVHKFTPDANGLWVLDETNGTKTVYGGVITGGTGYISSGGGIYNPGGNLTLAGGNITGNSSLFKGGGVYNCGDNSISGTFTMTGGTISGNTSVWGGGIYNYYYSGCSNSITMTGGTITGNYANGSGYGGGVFNENNATFNVGGTAVIEGNIRNGITSNFHIQNASGLGLITISTDTPLAEGAHIGISYYSNTRVSTNGQASDAQFFFADDGNGVGYDATNGYLKIVNKWVVTNESELTTAISGASDSDIIQLGADINLNATMNVNDTKNLTLDLNGYVLRQTTAGLRVVYIAIGGNFTIIDSNPNAVHYFTVGDDGLWTLNTTATSGTDWTTLTARPNSGDVIAVKGGVITGGDVYNGSGRVPDCGGGVYLDGNTSETAGTLNFNGGNIIGNKASSSGGGIYSKPGKININGGLIAGNIRGGVFQENNELTMTAGFVSFNTSNYGGGINSNWKSNAKFTMTGGTVSYNHATDQGGGVAIYHQGTLTGGAIIGNTCGDAGGGVYKNGNQNDYYLTIENCTIEGNSANYGGGVYYAGATTMTLSGTTTISGNTKLNGTTASNLYLPNGKAVTVSSLAAGANIGVTTATAPTTTTPVAITSNGADTDVQYFSSDIEAYEVVFNTDHLEMIIPPVCELYNGETLAGQYASVQAAIDANVGDSIVMIHNSQENITFPANTTYALNLNGKALYATSGSVVTNNGTLTMTDDDNETPHYFTVTSYKNVEYWEFIASPTAEQIAAATDIDSLTARPAVGDIIAVKGGVVAGGTGTSGDQGYYGGGIWNGSNASLTLTGVNIAGGKVSQRGGGIVSYGILHMTDCTVCGNFADYGGGVAIHSASGKEATLDNCRLSFNAIDGSYSCGGGVLNGGNLTTMNNCQIEYNKCNTTSGGAGVFNQSLLTMNNCTVAQNWAKSAGGGVKNAGSGTSQITGCIVTSNTSGGGVYNESGTLIITGSEITYNTGYGLYAGGAAVTLGGKVVITGNTVCNLQLPTGKTITVSTETPLASDANIGVTTATAPTAGSPVSISGTNTANYAMYFNSDDSKYAVVNEEYVVKLKVAVECDESTYTPTDIVNGSFQTQPTYAVNPQHGVGEGWNTTDPSGFEWASPGGYTYSTYGISTFPSGYDKDNYFIEMNNAKSAVFSQDLATHGGDVIRWGLWHGFRDISEEQRIRAEIGAPNGATSGTGSAVNANIKDEGKAVYNYNGVTHPGGTVYGYASNLGNLRLPYNSAATWYEVEGVYVVPKGQTTTRFAFIAEEPQTGIGNCLDQLTFSTLVGNLKAYNDESGNVIITGYWGDTDTSKKLCVKVEETVYQYDMSSVKTTCGGNFKITFPKSQIGSATQIEIYHQDYSSAKITLKIKKHVTLHFCTTESVTGAEDFYGYVPGETTQLPVVARNGYTFLGWYKDEGYTGSAVTEIGPTETSDALEYWAKWDVDITSDRWAAVVRAYDKGVRPLTGESYTYYPSGNAPATTVPYEGVLYTDAEGNKYYCYTTVEMAIEAAQAGSLNANYCGTDNPNGVFSEGTPYSYDTNDALNPNIINYTDVVTFNKDYTEKLLYNQGTSPTVAYTYGISKGIVVDLNSHTVKGIAMGNVADNQVLVVRNGNLGTTLEDVVFDDEAFVGSLSGKVVFQNVEMTGTIYSSQHSLYMLNGNYNIKLGDTENPSLLQLRGGYYTNDPTAYNIDYSDCHVELASADPTISPYFCRVVKGASQYTVHFVAGCSGVTCGGEAFESKDVAVTYGVALTEVPTLEKQNDVFLGWSDAATAPTVKYTAEQLATLTKTHNDNVYIYPVFGMELGVPVNVALYEGSDIPEIGREYTFNLNAETAGAPMPEVTTLTLAAPTATGEANKVGYNATDANHPWKVTMPKGVFTYSITQTIDTKEAETLDEGKWYIEMTTNPYAETANYQITLSQYNGKVDPLTKESFYIVKHYESGDYETTADVSVDEQGRTRMALGGGILTNAINNASDGTKQMNTAVIKGKFEVDFNRAFKAVGSLTPPPGATADGTLIGFIANTTVPTSGIINAGGYLGILHRSAFSNGIILEFDVYNNGSSFADPDPFYKHIALETLDGYGYPTGKEYWNMDSQWPTSACTYVIENDVENNVLKFTVTLPGGTQKVFTYNNPTAQFGTNKAYFLMSGSIRRGPANSYGVGNVGSTTPTMEMYFDSFNYIGRADGFTGQSIFVNKLDHVWEYTAEGTTIHARCKHDHTTEALNHCFKPGNHDLTLTVAESHDYDGTQNVATYTNAEDWESLGIELPTIMYEGRTPTTYGSTSTAPSSLGFYTASATKETAVVSSDFKIRPQIYCTSGDAEHGSVAITDSDDNVIPSGSFIDPYQEIKFTATPVAHWHFTEWTLAEKSGQTDNPVTVIMNVNVAHVIGNFAIDRHDLNIGVYKDGWGTVTVTEPKAKMPGDGTGVHTYDYGTGLTLNTEHTAEKYRFLYWGYVKDAGTEDADTVFVTDNSQFYFTLTQDTTFVAVYADEVHVRVEATPIDGGDVTIRNNKTGAFLEGDEQDHILWGTSVTIHAITKNEYAFKGWFKKGTSEMYSGKPTVTFDATENLDLEARFTNEVIWVRIKKK